MTKKISIFNAFRIFSYSKVFKTRLVVGFLCTYDTAYEFKDNTWVDITGTIVKGEYYGDIAQIKVDNMFECSEPENKFVSVPDNSYVPTSSMF